ncbi:Fe(3+) dicitrate ABC transporter substrate-binding protein [Psychromonas arctica]|uniref:Fe(3+) dicitrate ABC transporter substrate-binding protein n=1 Tax=Psychromonas arctica TaxID=168275 RepID=A0ABU9H819_9GAMM
MFFRLPSILLALLLIFFSYQVNAVTIKHQSGTLTLEKTPKRIVVLAFSFVDALAIAGVSPVGIADDGDKTRIIKSVRNLISDWKSVGSRYQPSLEAISDLKPDLIIADSGRHSSIYNGLSLIAPTLMLKSRGVTYRENLIEAQKIAAAIDKTEVVNLRLKQHYQLMSDFKDQLNTEETYQFAIISDKGMWMHSQYAYAGSVIKALGLNSSLINNSKKAYLQTSFEQLLKTNPDWLFVGQYTQTTVIDKWKKNPLWKLLAVAKSGQLITTSPNIWSLSSGVLAAEAIAKEITEFNNK